MDSTNTGFEESQSAYVAHGAPPAVGQIRRFGAAGPAYEVMAVGRSGRVTVEVITTSERLDCPFQEVAADPLAETIP